MKNFGIIFCAAIVLFTGTACAEGQPYRSPDTAESKEPLAAAVKEAQSVASGQSAQSWEKDMRSEGAYVSQAENAQSVSQLSLCVWYSDFSFSESEIREAFDKDFEIVAKQFSSLGIYFELAEFRENPMGGFGSEKIFLYERGTTIPSLVESEELGAFRVYIDKTGVDAQCNVLLILTGAEGFMGSEGSIRGIDGIGEPKTRVAVVFGYMSPTNSFPELLFAIIIQHELGHVLGAEHPKKVNMEEGMPPMSVMSSWCLFSFLPEACLEWGVEAEDQINTRTAPVFSFGEPVVP